MLGELPFPQKNSSKICVSVEREIFLCLLIISHDDPGWCYVLCDVCLWSLESADVGGWCLTGPGCLTLDTGH